MMDYCPPLFPPEYLLSPPLPPPTMSAPYQYHYQPLPPPSYHYQLPPPSYHYQSIPSPLPPPTQSVHYYQPFAPPTLQQSELRSHYAQVIYAAPPSPCVMLPYSTFTTQTTSATEANGGLPQTSSTSASQASLHFGSLPATSPQNLTHQSHHPAQPPTLQLIHADPNRVRNVQIGVARSESHLPGDKQAPASVAAPSLSGKYRALQPRMLRPRPTTTWKKRKKLLCNLDLGFCHAHKVFDRKPDPGAEVNLGVKMKAFNVEVSGSVFKRRVTVFEGEKDLKAELITEEVNAPQLLDEMLSSNSASHPILVRSMQPVIVTKSMASGQVTSTPPLLGCDGYINIFTRFSDQVEGLNCITEVFDPGILHHIASLSECIDQVMLWFKRVTYCDARTPIRICLRVLTDECMEVGMLQLLHHYTHIALVGHCNSLDFPHNLLWYELLTNGSLETWCSILMSIAPGELPLGIEDNWSSVINLLENVVSDIVLNLLGNNVVGDVLCMGDYEYKGLPDEASYREGANFFSLTRLPMEYKLVGKCESSLREVFVEAVRPELSIMLLHEIEAFMRAASVSNLKTSWVTHYDLKTSGFTICYAISGGDDTLGGASDGWEKCEPFRGMLIYRCKTVSMVASLLHLEPVSFELLEIVNHMSYTYPDRVGAAGLLQETPTMIKAWLHAYVLVMSLVLAVVLVALYGMCCRDESLRVLFDRQEENGMIWHIITGSTCGKETTHDLEFVTLINDMAIRPSTVPLDSLISLCGAVGALNMIGLVLFVVVLLKTTLVVKFAKHGEIDVIFQLFSEDRYQVVYMWSLLIIWLSIQCCGIQALVNMEAKNIHGLEPYDMLLQACCNVGLVLNGKQTFKQMMHALDLVPIVDHCGCSVDLLGRGGIRNELGAKPLERVTYTNHVKRIYQTCFGIINVNEKNVEADGSVEDVGKALPVHKIYAHVLPSALYDDFRKIISNISHLYRNVVELSYCSENEQHLLVYEFHSNGSLHCYLHRPQNYGKTLTWSVVLQSFVLDHEDCHLMRLLPLGDLGCDESSNHTYRSSRDKIHLSEKAKSNEISILVSNGMAGKLCVYKGTKLELEKKLKGVHWYMKVVLLVVGSCMKKHCEEK